MPLTIPPETFTEEKRVKSAGQRAYEADLVQRPTYHDGGARPPWRKLPAWKQQTWEPPFWRENAMSTLTEDELHSQIRLLRGLLMEARELWVCQPIPADPAAHKKMFEMGAAYIVRIDKAMELTA